MKRLQFLLLDAGPIIKLFEANLWDAFLEKFDVTITRTVCDEVVYCQAEEERRFLPVLEDYQKKGLKIVDVESCEVRNFMQRFGNLKSDIHDGEKESLAYLLSSSVSILICSSDKAVFRTLGSMRLSERGISLEELLQSAGVVRKLDWPFTKKFREKYSMMGEIDSIQGLGSI